jgi:hypothetical protein
VEIACIVEGDGEVQAVPLLVRRIIQESFPSLYVPVSVARNFRGRTKLMNRALFQTAVDGSARRIRRPGGILVLLDADSDCPVDLGRTLLSWAHEVRADVLTSVVVADREYETWFLAAADSLRNVRGLPANLTAPILLEAVQGAKEWLTSQIPLASPYSPTKHQASFSAQMGLALARERSRSFRKLEKEVQALIAALQTADA